MTDKEKKPQDEIRRDSLDDSLKERVSVDEITQGLDKDYEFGFHDTYQASVKLEKGLNEDIVRQISAIKQEPEWMTNFRLKSFHQFQKMPDPDFGAIAGVPPLDYQDYYYYVRATEKPGGSWDDVPDTIKQTFDKLGIPQNERRFFSGVATQYESEVVYQKMQQNLEDLGVIFLDTDTAMLEHPEFFKEYFGKIVPARDNKFAALNSAVWSGGSFVYVPKGVKVPQPVQSYFRINTEQMGQFERTLIIVDEGADLHYIEGCTAPTYDTNNLHAAIVEIYVKKGGHCRYTTVQNWSTNVYNLVTQRALVDDDGSMEWVDGNMGSALNMKYPATILKGDRSKSTTISIAVAGKGQVQDTGSRMIHIGEDTSSTIISKSLARNGGEATYRGTVEHGPKALRAKTHVECDTLILDAQSKSDTVPTNRIKNGTTELTHEAKVSRISEEQLFYLTSRGIPEEKATEMIIMGFIEPFTRELPMEYAIELNQLMKMDTSGSVG